MIDPSKIIMNDTRHFTDIWFSVTATLEPCNVEFDVFEINELDGDGKVFAMSDLLMHGNVKWDGCSNWEMNNQYCWHACTRAQLGNLSTVMQRCWDWAKEIMPEFDGEVGS